MFFKKFIIIYKKIINLVLSKSLLYILIFGQNIHKGLFFSIFVTNEIFKILFTKRKVIRYFHFINIYVVYQYRAFILMKFKLFNFRIMKICNFFFHFYVWFKFLITFVIYNFSTFFNLNQLFKVNSCLN